jgi:hypothetical protein
VLGGLLRLGELAPSAVNRFFWSYKTTSTCATPLVTLTRLTTLRLLPVARTRTV